MEKVPLHLVVLADEHLVHHGRDARPPQSLRSLVRRHERGSLRRWRRSVWRRTPMRRSVRWGGYKGRLQATRAYKQKRGYNGQVATRAYTQKRGYNGRLQDESVQQKGCTTKTYRTADDNERVPDAAELDVNRAPAPIGLPGHTNRSMESHGRCLAALAHAISPCSTTTYFVLLPPAPHPGFGIGSALGLAPSVFSAMPCDPRLRDYFLLDVNTRDDRGTSHSARGAAGSSS